MQNFNKNGHISRFCKALAQPITQVPDCGVSPTWNEYGETGHFKRDCPRARNVGGDGRVLMITAGETLPEPHVNIGTFPKQKYLSLKFY